MKNARSLIKLLVLTILISAACSSRESSSNSGPDKQSLATPASTSNTVASDYSRTNTSTANISTSAAAPKAFMTEAAHGGIAEVEMGKLAAEKAQNAEVKKFGQMMVADHGVANTELKSLANAKKVELPTAPGAEHKRKLDEMRRLSGSEFDKAYVDDMVADHEKDVAAFKSQAEGSPDPEVKEFARKTLPTLEKHLELIKAIASKLK